MKKLLVIATGILFVISCSKKASPSASNTSGSNTSGVAATSSSSTPSAEPKTAPAPAPAAVNTNTDAASTSAKTTREPGKLSIEQQGQATFSAKCGKCHGLKVTTDYTVNRWIEVMQVMAIKANLSEVEKENVLAYVKANAKKG